MMMHAAFGGYTMFLWMFIQWGLLLLGVYLVIRWVKKEHPNVPSSGDHALQILRERFARGEITEEEFERMMERLKTGTGYHK